MPACLAHLKPSMAIIHLCALCLSAQRCIKMLFHHAHSHCSTTRFSAKVLFTTFTALHSCAPLLPPITGSPDESAVRLAPEPSHTVQCCRCCFFFRISVFLLYLFFLIENLDFFQLW